MLYGSLDTVLKTKDQGEFSAIQQHTRLRMTMRQNDVRYGRGSARGRREEPEGERMRIR